MPTQTQLLAAGRADLAGAIRRHTWPAVASAAGLPLSSIARPRSLNLVYATDLRLASGRMRPYMYWRDFTHVRNELLEFVEACHGTPTGPLPSSRDLIRAGRSDLARAVSRHGGWTAVRARLAREYDLCVAGGGDELECGQVPDLSDGEDVEDIRDESASSSSSGMIQQGRRRHNRRRAPGFWKSRDAVCACVHDCIKDIRANDPKRHPMDMPSRKELLAIGRGDVASGIARLRFSAVATMCGLNASRRGRRPAVKE